MKRLAEKHSKHRWLFFGLALACCHPAGLLRAGDPIVFSADKLKVPPELERNKDKDLLRSWSTLPRHEPFDGYFPPSDSTLSIDPRQQKKWKNNQAERKNWLVLEPGELQNLDDTMSFGIKEYSLDKKEEIKDYTFYNLRRPKTPELARPAGQRSNNTSGQTALGQNSRDDWDLDGNDDSLGSISFGSDKESRDKKALARETKESTWAKPFLPEKQENSLYGLDQSDFTLPSLFNTPGLPPGSRGQQARPGAFQQGVGPGQPASGLSGLSPQGNSLLPDNSKPDIISISGSPASASGGLFPPNQAVGGSDRLFPSSLPGLNSTRAPGLSGDLSMPSARPPQSSNPLGQSPLTAPPRRSKF